MSKAAREDPILSVQTADEIADVLIYLIRLADVLDLDLDHAVWLKIRTNEDRFPPPGP